jgi:Malic enzyme, NAD binding domain
VSLRPELESPYREFRHGLSSDSTIKRPACSAERNSAHESGAQAASSYNRKGKPGKETADRSNSPSPEIYDIALKWSEERVRFADFLGRLRSFFPGLALGVVTAQARRVIDRMIMASAKALAALSPNSIDSNGDVP